MGTLGLDLANAATFALLGAPLERTSLILRTQPEFDRLERRNLARRQHHTHPMETDAHHDNDHDHTHISPSTNSEKRGRQGTYQTLKTLYGEDKLQGLWRGWTLSAVYCCGRRILTNATDSVMTEYFPNYALATDVSSGYIHITPGTPGYWSWLATRSLVSIGIEGLVTLVVHPATLLHIRYTTDRPGYGASSSLTTSTTTTTFTTTTKKQMESPEEANSGTTSSSTWAWSSASSRTGGAYRYNDIRDLFQQTWRGSSSTVRRSSSSSSCNTKNLRRLYKGWPAHWMASSVAVVGTQIIADIVVHNISRYVQYLERTDASNRYFKIWFLGFVSFSSLGALVSVGVYATNTLMARAVVRDDDEEDGSEGRWLLPSSFWRVAKTIVHEEGWSALWHGFTSYTLATMMPSVILVGSSLIWYSPEC